MRNPAPLQPSLDRFKNDWEARVGADIADLIAADIETLRHSGILTRAAQVGDLWPQAPLTDALCKPFDLGYVLKCRPAIISFYRGGWCPYCNLELRAWQAVLPEITALGANFIAISPERPDQSMTTAEKNGLAFPVLSDAGSVLADALGIRFTLSETLRPFYEAAGHALPDRNGDPSWVLPIPATFVVDQGGRIAAAFVEPDYRKRTDPAVALDVLRSLPSAKAA